MTPGLKTHTIVLTGIQESQVPCVTESCHLPFLYVGANFGCLSKSCEYLSTHTELVVPGFHFTNKKANPAFISTPVNEEKTLEPITLTALDNS